MATIGLKDGTYKTSDGKTVVVKSGPKGNAPMPITRSTSGDQLKEVRPGVYVSSGGRLSRTTTTTPTPTPETTEANFSGMDGQSYKVTYAKETPTSQKIPNSGITRELAQKGAFGTTTFAKDQSIEPLQRQKHDSLANRPQYSSDYGYSTKTGYAEIFYNKKEPEPEPSLKKIKEDFIGAKKSYLERQQYGISPPTANEQNKLLGASVRTLGVAEYRTGKYLYKKGTEGKPTLNAQIGTFLMGEGKGLYGDPGKSLSTTGTSIIVGYGVGKVAGMGVKKLASVETKALGKAPIATKINRIGVPVTGSIAVGYGGYEVLTATGEPTNTIPTFIGGGIGFVKGYGSVIKPTSIESPRPYSNVKVKGLMRMLLFRTLLFVLVLVLFHYSVSFGWLVFLSHR